MPDRFVVKEVGFKAIDDMSGDPYAPNGWFTEYQVTDTQTNRVRFVTVQGHDEDLALAIAVGSFGGESYTITDSEPPEPPSAAMPS